MIFTVSFMYISDILFVYTSGEKAHSLNPSILKSETTDANTLNLLNGMNDSDVLIAGIAAKSLE